MKVLTMTLGLLFLLSFAAPGVASNGFIPGSMSPGHGYGALPLTELVDEWNGDQPHSPAGTYAGGCFAFPFEPPVDYVLERVEFFAGGVGGMVTVEIRADNYNGPILGDANYMEDATHAWQGENLDPSVPLSMGTIYFLIYNVVPGADGSTSAVGDIIPYYFASDCSSYGDLWETIPWKARFYGYFTTANEASNWGMIKSLY